MDISADDLPDELRDGYKPVDTQARLKEVGEIIASKREEAKRERKASGIEDIWLECEEAYIGIDDENREEFSGAKWAKPTTMNGGLTYLGNRKNSEVRSNAYVRLTSRYVDAGTAKVCEILLAADDKSFSFDPSPVPELVNKTQDNTPIIGQNGMPVMKNEQQPATVSDIAHEMLKSANDAAKKAETRIYDWMVEAGFAREARKTVFDAARLGSGVIKGPFPQYRTEKALSMMDGAVALHIVKKLAPNLKSIDPWNFFPDPACGENVQDGDFCFERDFITASKLRKLKHEPGYLPDQIEKVIKEGPGKINIENDRPDDKVKKNRFEIWYYYGTITRDDMMVANSGIELPDDIDEVSAIVTLVNDTVIRATINPLNSGMFPYHAVPWQRRASSWCGIGIGEQLRTPRRICNAATRALLNNAGKSSGVQLVIDKSLIPADGSYALTPDKVWYPSNDSVMDDVRKAFFMAQFPNIGPQLMPIIEYSFRLAEEATNIPLITQGQSGDTTPDTFSGQQLQNNNANQLLRNVGYQFDDFITEPLVNMLYEWLLLDPEVPDDEKGDFKINAHGSSAMVERAIQDQFLMQMGAMVLNPAFGSDPQKWLKQVLKAKHIDPRDVLYTDEEMQQMRQQQPPADPRIEVAKINAEVRQQTTATESELRKQIADLEARVDLERIKRDTDRDTIYVAAETQRTNVEHESRYAEMQMRERLAMLDYANKHQITIEQIKSKLASDAMKLRTQKELSLAGMEADLHKHHNPQVIQPPTEPVGRADNGQAFTQ